MSSFSGVMFVLFCFVSVFLLSLKPGPFVLHSSICMRPDNHTQLPENCLRPFLFLLFFFGDDVAFSEYFCNITVFSLYEEYVVRSPAPHLDDVFLPWDHGRDS